MNTVFRIWRRDKKHPDCIDYINIQIKGYGFALFRDCGELFFYIYFGRRGISRHSGYWVPYCVDKTNCK